MTVTSTRPMGPAGVVQVICVAETTATLVALIPAKVTVSPATKPVPPMVTLVLPARDPLFGVTLVVPGPVT